MFLSSISAWTFFFIQSHAGNIEIISQTFPSSFIMQISQKSMMWEIFPFKFLFVGTKFFEFFFTPPFLPSSRANKENQKRKKVSKRSDFPEIFHPPRLLFNVRFVFHSAPSIFSISWDEDERKERRELAKERKNHSKENGGNGFSFYTIFYAVYTPTSRSLLPSPLIIIKKNSLVVISEERALNRKRCGDGREIIAIFYGFMLSQLTSPHPKYCRKID